MKLYELSQMKTKIDDQFKEIKRAYGRGVLEFSFRGVGYYNAKKIILLGSSFVNIMAVVHIFFS